MVKFFTSILVFFLIPYPLPPPPAPSPLSHAYQDGTLAVPTKVSRLHQLFLRRRRRILRMDLLRRITIDFRRIPPLCSKTPPSAGNTRCRRSACCRFRVTKSSKSGEILPAAPPPPPFTSRTIGFSIRRSEEAAAAAVAVAEEIPRLLTACSALRGLRVTHRPRLVPNPHPPALISTAAFI